MLEISIASLREQYAGRRQEIRDRFFADHDAVQARRSSTEEADRIVQQLAASHLPEDECSIVAIGGYGRQQLYPFSDVDLLFIYAPRRKQAAEAKIRSMLHDLWDLNFHVGQQVWSLADLEDLTLDHLEFILAMLDARVLAGDRALGAKVVHDIFSPFVENKQEELTQRIIEATEDRHASYRETIYQLEPDLKDAPGGLRDYLAGQWLIRLDRRATFLPFSEADVEQAHEFIARLRTFVHFLSNRNQNRLSHRLQEEVGRRVAPGEASAKSRVESLMKEYFLNARILHGFCHKLMRDRKAGPAPLEFELPPEATLESAEDVLEVFCRSVLEQRPLSDRTRNAIVDALPHFSQSLNYRVMRDIIRDLFRPRAGLYQTLTEMYELGVLERLLPEFANIKARVIRDFYHKYTVDEHTLLAIKNVEELAFTEEPSDLRFKSLLGEVPDPEVLTLTLLLHDVGKGREGEHVERGARMAAAALRRIQFPKDDIHTVVFLIRNHLAMSTVIFRRDLEDEEVIQRFVDLVGDTRRLRFLCLLTYADIKAVAPGTLNEWKKDLLWQLYVAAYHKLTLGYGEKRIEEEDIGERLLAGLPVDLDREGFERFLEGFPRRYLLTTPEEEISQHYGLACRLDRDHPIQLRLSHRGTHWELCVVTPDRYFLFAKIVGLLSYFDMNILRGYGFSNRQNTVLDFFQFDDTRNVFQLNPEERERFRKLLAQAVKDEVSLEKLLEGKEKSVVFRPVSAPFEPAIYFENEYPGDYTIMEIVAPDSIGLLYRIGREISGLRCNIELVLINTEGDKAVDVFYLTHETGKLDGRLQEDLSERIIQSITGREKR